MSVATVLDLYVTIYHKIEKYCYGYGHHGHRFIEKIMILSIKLKWTSNVHYSLDDLVKRHRDRAVVAEHEPREQAAVSGHGRAVRDLGDCLVRRFVVQRPADVRLAVAADQQANQRDRPQRQPGQPHGGDTAVGPRKQIRKRGNPGDTKK